MELWRKIRNQKLVASAAHLLYSLRVRAPADPADTRLSFAARRQGAVKVAFICDEMTWEDYRGICEGIFLHPSCWRRQLAAFAPDFVFCESAWCGIDAFPNVWRARIYKDRRLLFENRKTLLEILDYCRENAIPTVFWNKEDPTFFDDAVYDFTPTALLFDTVFTTARECVPRYRARGHERVFVLPFGVSEAYFHVDGSKREKNSAVFFGSYFRDLHTRCDALETLLDYVLEQGMRLDIYDRKSQSPDEKFRYPQKYQRYVRAAVPYADIPGLCGRYEYAVNVNTVTDSETMFSRRLLQMAAAGLKVLSNPFEAAGELSGISCREIADGIVLLRGEAERLRAEYSLEEQFEKMVGQIGI